MYDVDDVLQFLKSLLMDIHNSFTDILKYIFGYIYPKYIFGYL